MKYYLYLLLTILFLSIPYIGFSEDNLVYNSTDTLQPTVSDPLYNWAFGISYQSQIPYRFYKEPFYSVGFKTAFQIRYNNIFAIVQELSIGYNKLLLYGGNYAHSMYLGYNLALRLYIKEVVFLQGGLGTQAGFCFSCNNQKQTTQIDNVRLGNFYSFIGLGGCFNIYSNLFIMLVGNVVWDTPSFSRIGKIRPSLNTEAFISMNL